MEVSVTSIFRTVVQATLLSLTALSCGCTSGPDFVRPGKPDVDSYTPEPLALTTSSADTLGGAPQQFVMGADVGGQWWSLYQSPQLDALVEEALKANPTVAAAQASLRQARELYFAQVGGLFPQINANAQGEKQLVQNAASGATGNSGVFGVATASLSIAYSPDIFGGVRRQVESQAAQADYQRFQLEATYLTLTSNVVNAAVNLASLRAQVAATHDLIRIVGNQLDVVKSQFDAGSVSRLEVLSQQSALEQIRATLPPLERSLAQQRNQLMALVGRLPSADRGEVIDLDSLHLPEELPLSLPSKLVEQRPDVRSAEAQLHSASANIGVAVSNQLPQFTITGQYGPTATSFEQIILSQFSQSASIWTLGAWNIALAVLQPLFDGGTLEHRKRAARAAFEVSAAQYRSAVLQAFLDVANALRALQTDADALRTQADAERAAAASLALAQQQFQLGAVAFSILLTAQQTYSTAVLNRVRAQAARYSDTAALFQALGGGWWNRADVDPKSEGKHTPFWLPPFGDVRLPAPGR
jgi:NodT family efflux transporter outer membrane factor (OMF) lipoprotein